MLCSAIILTSKPTNLRSAFKSMKTRQVIYKVNFKKRTQLGEYLGMVNLGFGRLPMKALSGIST